MEDLTRMRDLAEKWLNGTITEDEKKSFEDWYNTQPEADLEWTGDASEDELRQRLLLALIEKIEAEEANANVVQIPRKNIFRRIVVAASIIFVVAAGGYLALHNVNSEKPVARLDKTLKHDVDPGRYKAKLTLSNGSSIILDSAAQGELAKQGNVVISNKDRQLVYQGETSNVKSEILYNTLSTARGETYATTLSDGSKVWLNSESTIKFPVGFTGSERKVEITGEAYFEVAHDPGKPFIVSANGLAVEVLGTHFNVNAYSNEPQIKTTLFEGAVKLTLRQAQGGAVGQSAILRPGQQAQTSASIKVVSDINTDEVISWKDGLFHFESADLKTILREFARWYDIEVIYDGPVSSEKYFTIMSRNTTLATVLKSLQANEVKFRIEGRKLFVHSG